LELADESLVTLAPVSTDPSNESITRWMRTTEEHDTLSSSSGDSSVKMRSRKKTMELNKIRLYHCPHDSNLGVSTLLRTSNSSTFISHSKESLREWDIETGSLVTKFTHPFERNSVALQYVVYVAARGRHRVDFCELISSSQTFDTTGDAKDGEGALVAATDTGSLVVWKLPNKTDKKRIEAEVNVTNTERSQFDLEPLMPVWETLMWSQIISLNCRVSSLTAIDYDLQNYDSSSSGNSCSIFVVVATTTGSLHVWDVTTATLTRVIASDIGVGFSSIVQLRGNTLVCSTVRSLQFFRPEVATTLEIKHVNHRVDGMRRLNDGTRVVTFSAVLEQSVFHCWNGDGECLFASNPFQGRVRFLTHLSSDPGLLALGFSHGKLQLWNISQRYLDNQ